MKFSILIPTSPGRLNYLKNCLNSILSQKVKPFEVIISLDGTDKDIENFLGNFKKNHEIKIFIQKEKLGMVGNKNIIAEYANGDIFCFVDDDITLNKNWLYYIKEIFKKYPDVSIVGGKIIFIKKRFERELLYMPTKILNVIKNLFIKKTNESEVEVDFLIGSALAIKKEVYKNLGGRDKWLIDAYEDIELCLRARSLNYKIIYNPKAIAYEWSAPKDYSEVFYREIRNRIFVFLKYEFFKNPLAKFFFYLHILWIVFLSFILSLYKLKYLNGIKGIIDGFKKLNESKIKS